MNSLLFSYEDFSGTKTRTTSKQPRIKNDGYHDGVYSSLQRSIEDLQFLDVYDKLQNINSIEKMKMLHRIKVKCSNLKLENNNAWNSLESYCRSIEGSEGLAAVTEQSTHGYLKDKPKIVKFILHIGEFIIRIITAIINFFVDFVRGFVSAFAHAMVKSKALSKNDIISPEDYIDKYGKDSEWYDIYSPTYKKQGIDTFGQILGGVADAIHYHIHEYQIKAKNALTDASVGSIWAQSGLRTHATDDEIFALLEKPTQHVDESDIMFAITGIRKMKDKDITPMITKLDPKRVQEILIEVDNSRRTFDTNIRKFKRAATTLRFFTKNADRVDNLKGHALVACKCIIANASRTSKEFAKLVQFCFRLIHRTKDGYKGSGYENNVKDDFKAIDKVYNDNFQKEYSEILAKDPLSKDFPDALNKFMDRPRQDQTFLI